MKMTRVSYELSHIQHYYGYKKVLDIDKLQIFQGSITGLSGPNGSGKSTLLKIMAFAMKPSLGQVKFKGRKEFPFSSRVRSRISLLTQKPYLLKRTVFENIAYGLKIRKDLDNLENRIKDSLETVGLDFQGFAQRKWHELSGGEAQRVAMAARLILKPEVLLLDEPVASVDIKSASLIRKASLAARDDWGCTLVIASHDLQWLYEASDTRISMARGRIFSTGSENIIPPPYDLSIKEAPLKQLDNGEHILLPPFFSKEDRKEDRENSTAIIQTDRLCICTEKDSNNKFNNQVTGQIISMLLEKNCGHIMTSIQVGDFSLNLSFSPDRAAELGLQPGKKIIFMFRSKDIEWR
jgi:tungstate transport system ATP-binding protein